MSFVHRVDELFGEHGSGLTGKAEHWGRVRLADVAKVVNGFPFPSSGFNNEAGEPVLRIRDITTGKVGTYFNGPVEGAPRVDHGDLVVGMDGDFNSRLWPGENALMNQRVCKITTDESFYSKSLLAYALPGYLKIVNEHTSAVTVKHLSSGTIADLPLPLPPRPEQDRLVSKLDELFSRIDEGERALERVQTLAERYRASVLKAAVEGELTREWREKSKGKFESGEALLARILKARREAWEKAELAKMKAKGIRPANDLWKQKYEESPAPDTSNLPELPNGWVWTNLAQIKLFSLYGPRFSSEDYAENGCLVLRTSDINESGRVNVATAPKLKLSNEEFQKYKAQKGDLLITRTGSLGTLALFDDDVDAIPGAYLIQYRVPAPSVTRWYLFHFLKSPVGQHRLLTGGAGIGRPNLNAPTIEAIPIPLPPLGEQEAIVDRIERALELVEKQLELLAMEAARSRALRQATLKSAFVGDLVAQDPADEPASILLARIAAERGTDNAAPKRGRKKKTAA